MTQAPFGAVCIHDSLRRSCEVCELTDRLEQAEAEIACVYPHDGFWSVEVRQGKVIAVIKLVQSIEDVTQ